MNNQLWAFAALELARQRAEEADRYQYHYHRASLASEGQPSLSSRLRRSLARGLAAVSRGSAADVRMLDGCIADDLGRSLARTK